LSRITPVSWKILECVFKLFGFEYAGKTGSHRKYIKSGCMRPVIIPEYPAIDRDIILANMGTAGMSREKYFEMLVRS
jgi:hypothetical protein